MIKTKMHRPEVVKATNAILGIPSGPKRWRASAALAMNLNPVSDDGRSVQDEYNDIVESNKEVRLMQANDFASSVTYQDQTDGTKKDGFLRLGLRMPATILTFIELYDKPAFDPKNPDCKANLHRLMKEFPEFCIPRRI